MFERFTDEARSVVTTSQDEARALRDRFIGTEHLLLAMLTLGGLGGDLLTARGMSAETVRPQLGTRDRPDTGLDADALSTLGIDLEQVRRAAEEQFGPGALAGKPRPVPRGHIPFSKRAKKVLELSVREAQSLNSPSINSAHLLLGLITDREGFAARLIVQACPDVDSLVAETRAAAGRQAA
jgi:ATP-dependent Clp protease ATP-binding subunit ClpA